MRLEERDFNLILTDGKTVTVNLGTFRACTIMEAQKKAKKRYSGMFRRLQLADWKIAEVRKQEETT